MKLAIAFPNFGPYHRARLRALGESLQGDGGTLIAHEVAGEERKYPWESSGISEAYRRETLFPGRALEDISDIECKAAMTKALDRDDPDAVAICGYARPESMAALRWAEVRKRPAILMSESQEIDRPRTWWKEAIKGRRVRRFSSALVGGNRHRDYLVKLGMPAERIAMGYNAVDNAQFAAMADEALRSPAGRQGLPNSPYFLAVSRFVPEKNLRRLIRAFASYRASAGSNAWDLMLCGGGPGEQEVRTAIEASGYSQVIHCPGFLHGHELSRHYAFAGAFVLPSLSEPWGLVANEAAACGVPLLISDRAGCVETLVPESSQTGLRFAPEDEDEILACLVRVASLGETERRAMGHLAANAVAEWGPERFALGMREALGFARLAVKRFARRGQTIDSQIQAG